MGSSARPAIPESSKSARVTTPRTKDVLSEKPLWATNAHTLFNRLLDFNPIWKEILDDWTRLENRKGYSSGTEKLKAGGRPKCVSYWIQCARTAHPNLDNKQYLIDDFDKYAAGFWEWWVSVQPSFREESVTKDGLLETKKPDSTIKDPWSGIDIAGQNGLVSALAALFFWGWRIEVMPRDGYRNAQTRGAALEMWVKAAKDVRFVLGCLFEDNLDI